MGLPFLLNYRFCKRSVLCLFHILFLESSSSLLSTELISLEQIIQVSLASVSNCMLVPLELT